MTYFRILSEDDEHVATVKADFVEEHIAYYNSRRELNIDGEPIGEYRAEPYEGYVAGDR